MGRAGPSGRLCRASALQWGIAPHPAAASRAGTGRSGRTSLKPSACRRPLPSVGPSRPVAPFTRGRGAGCRRDRVSRVCPARNARRRQWRYVLSGRCRGGGRSRSGRGCPRIVGCHCLQTDGRACEAVSQGGRRSRDRRIPAVVERPGGALPPGRDGVSARSGAACGLYRCDRRCRGPWPPRSRRLPPGCGTRRRRGARRRRLRTR